MCSAPTPRQHPLVNSTQQNIKNTHSDVLLSVLLHHTGSQSSPKDSVWNYVPLFIQLCLFYWYQTHRMWICRSSLVKCVWGGSLHLQPFRSQTQVSTRGVKHSPQSSTCLEYVCVSVHVCFKVQHESITQPQLNHLRGEQLLKSTHEIFGLISSVPF